MTQAPEYPSGTRTTLTLRSGARSKKVRPGRFALVGLTEPVSLSPASWIELSGGVVACRRPRNACHWRDQGMTNAWVARFGRWAVSSPDEPGPAFSGKSAASGRPCAIRFPK